MLKDRLWRKKSPKQTENYSKHIEDVIFNSAARISNFSICSISYGYWAKPTNVQKQRLGRFLSPFIIIYIYIIYIYMYVYILHIHILYIYIYIYI